MAWGLTGNKPLPDPMMTHFNDTYSSSSLSDLTHWGQDEMAAITQTTLSKAYSWMILFQFQIIFHWNVLNMWQAIIWTYNGLVCWRIYVSLSLNELRMNCWKTQRICWMLWYFATIFSIPTQLILILLSSENHLDDKITTVTVIGYTWCETWASIMIASLYKYIDDPKAI